MIASLVDTYSDIDLFQEAITRVRGRQHAACHLCAPVGRTRRRTRRPDGFTAWDVGDVSRMRVEQRITGKVRGRSGVAGSIHVVFSANVGESGSRTVMSHRVSESEGSEPGTGVEGEEERDDATDRS